MTASGFGEEDMKERKVYGMLAAAPIDFPDEIELGSIRTTKRQP